MEEYHIDCIKYDILRNDINVELRNNHVVICNSICILDILSNLGVSPDLKIYCKRLSEDGEWVDSKYFNYRIPIDDIFLELDNTARINFKIERKNNYIPGKSDPLLREIIRYHFKFKPDLNYDIIYTWREDAG